MSDQYQPRHSARDKSSINFMLILGLVAAVADIFTGSGALLVIGLGVAIYAWFTTPTNYSLYNDRLLIFYGRPRVRHVMFDNIEGVDNLMVPLSGPRLRVREFRGRGVWLTPRDPETFMEQFRIAMEQFRGTATEDSSEADFVPFQREEASEGSLPGDQASETVVDDQAREPTADEYTEAESQGSSFPEQEDPWGRR
jgi:hypothetical protein